jgi:hypothetical protein
MGTEEGVDWKRCPAPAALIRIRRRIRVPARNSSRTSSSQQGRGELNSSIFNSRLIRLNRLLHEFPLHKVSPVSECAALIEIHVVPLLGFELDLELTVKDE